LDVLESIMKASGEQKKEKLPTLEKASLKLNMMRVFIRLMKDAKTIDAKKYMILESVIDEIGRMLGDGFARLKPSRVRERVPMRVPFLNKEE